MFTAPTAFRAIKREDPEGALMKRYDLSNFVTLFLAGERTDPDTLQWAETLLQKPVIDHWWQTESGWPMAANCMGLHHFPVLNRVRRLSRCRGGMCTLSTRTAKISRPATLAPSSSSCRYPRARCRLCGMPMSATSNPI